MLTAIIPARGGSKRIPRKNIRMFMGKPIIAYSIATAQESGLFGKILVSTEDAEIAALAVSLGAEVVDRPAALADDKVGTQEVVRHALTFTRDEYICCILATAPMMTVDSLKLAYEELRHRPLMMYAISVGTEPPSGLQDAAQFYMGRRAAFKHDRPLIGPNTIMIPVQNVCDIDTEQDWKRAEKMYGSSLVLEDAL